MINFHPSTGDAINPTWVVDPRTNKAITSSVEEREALQTALLTSASVTTPQSQKKGNDILSKISKLSSEVDSLLQDLDGELKTKEKAGENTRPLEQHITKWDGISQQLKKMA